MTYSVNPADNTTIGGVDVGEDCDPGNVNDAIRQLAADFAGALTVPTGEYGSAFPAAATRASKVAAFDNLGNATAVALSGVYNGSQALMASSRVALSSLTGMTNGQSAVLTESGREGVFTWSTANLASKVTIDTQQGVYVAPATDTTGASGAWVRQFGGALNLKWFGALADNSTDIAPALLGAIAVAAALGPGIVGAVYKPSLPIYIPAGLYKCNSTIELKSAIVHIYGDGRGQATGQGTTITWPANTTAFTIQQASSTGYTAAATTTTTGADGSILERLGLYGSGTYGNVADGILMRARAIIRDCYISGFSRDGISIQAATGGSPMYGNANNWVVERCALYNNKRHGLYVTGSDANAGEATMVDASYNGEWGILDASFLGNAYFACHASANGAKALYSYTGTGGATQSWFVVKGQEGPAATTAPAANSTIWKEVSGATGGTPWTSGVTIYTGGSYCINGTLYNCYSEGGQGYVQSLTYPSSSLVIGGIHGASGQAVYEVPRIRPGSGLYSVATVTAESALAVYHTNNLGVLTDVQIGDATGGDNRVFSRRNSNLTAAYAFTDKILPGDQYQFACSNNPIWNAFGPNPTSSTLANAGRTAGVPWLFQPYELCIRTYDNGYDGRIVHYGNGPPPSGYHAQGEWVMATSPVAGGKVGWVCVASGTPGTWKPFGAIDA